MRYHPSLSVAALLVACLPCGSGPAAGRVLSAPDDLDNTFSLAKRHRLEFSMGTWDSGSRLDLSPATRMPDESSVTDLVAAVSYVWWARESVAAHVTVRGLIVEAGTIRDAVGELDHAVVITSALLGARLYPLSAPRFPLRPYVTAGIGPTVGVEHTKRVRPGGVESTETQASFGGHLGSGLDLQLGRHLMLSVQAGYDFLADFPEPLAGRKNYSGMEFGGGLSLLFGKGAHGR